MVQSRTLLQLLRCSWPGHADPRLMLPLSSSSAQAATKAAPPCALPRPGEGLAERAGDKKPLVRLGLEKERARRPRDHEVEERVDEELIGRAERVRAHPAARGAGVRMLDGVVGREHRAAEGHHLDAPADVGAPDGHDAAVRPHCVADGELSRKLDCAVGEDDARVTTIADRRRAVRLEAERLAPLEVEAGVATGARRDVRADHFRRRQVGCHL
eukprot:scaffold53079_cov70-Phaeocystis_antarctica.AAC.3